MGRVGFEKNLSISQCAIPGFRVVDLAVHGDSRSWFKENWRREKMCALGLPGHSWMQNNISFNDKACLMRGVRAEPWDKLVSVAAGRIFGAWMDLRQRESFGGVFACKVNPSVVVYVPRGVDNAYQALEDGTAYCALVDARWSAELKKTYTFVNLADPILNIKWLISIGEAVVSDADRGQPMFIDATPMAPRRTFVIGSNGQLGCAVRSLAKGCDVARWYDFTDFAEFDFSDEVVYSNIDWSQYGAVNNCGVYTAVDKAETPAGRVAAWKANAISQVLLVHACAEHGIILVHISSDYIFDGTRGLHDEAEPLSPLSVYCQSKAAGDLAVAGCRRHYILRSSWVIGDGRNVEKTMQPFSDRCATPSDNLNEVTVVNDQFGRLAFAKDMASAIFHLLGYRWGDVEPNAPAPYGTYDCTGSGRVASCAEIATEFFEHANRNDSLVCSITTAENFASARGELPRALSAPRSTSRSWRRRAFACPTGRKGSTTLKFGLPRRRTNL